MISERLSKISRKVNRLAQIDSFKKGLLVLESNEAAPAAQSLPPAQSSPGAKATTSASFVETASPPDTQSDRAVDKVEQLFTNWWHRPIAGKPLRLLSKCVARYLQNSLKGEQGDQFRSDLIETAFEGVAKLAKVDSDQIEHLEKRLKDLEAELSSRKSV